MTMKSINESTNVVESENCSTWMIFPEEVEESLACIIKPYVDTSDSEAESIASRILSKIEMSCRSQFGRIPWAIVFFPKEYPLSGHLLNIRSSLDVRFSAYSVIEMKQYDPNVLGAPPLSILWFFTKESLLKTAERKSPMLAGIYEAMRDVDEDGCWTMIADPLDPEWVANAAKTNSALFFQAVGH
jgi:hypothetical protein